MAEHFENLRDYLERTETRLEDFAARIGVGAPYVSMLANGQRRPSLPLAIKIATEARIPIESLLTGAASPDEDVA